MFPLLKCFGDKIIKTNINGRPNVVTFRTRSTAILSLSCESFTSASPFSIDTNNNLRNILNGANADSNVNAEKTKSVGEKILLSMNGMLAPNYSFRI